MAPMHPSARHFIDHETQFHLGSVLTEQPHPTTMELSRVARRSATAGAAQLLAVDEDVRRMLAAWCCTDRPREMADDVAAALQRGGRVFFTGCGSTGRLSILLDATWRRFWDEHPRMADATRSVMAGGDFALIRSVEGYEDFIALGRRQIADRGVCERDVVFAITEGGETSFVIGTAWAALDAGATVYFVYNNPDDVLAAIARSHETITHARGRSVCLATGPMAISGSTRMQATTAELAAVGLALEMALDHLHPRPDGTGITPDTWPDDFAHLLAALATPENTETLGRVALMERECYEARGLLTYAACDYALDLLTDTTERSPTFLIPPFARRGDETSAPSWSFLVTSCPSPADAWSELLRRPFNDIRWRRDEIETMVGAEAPLARVFPPLDRDEILRFDISREGLARRLRRPADRLVLFVVGREADDAQRLTAHYAPLVAQAAAQGCGTAVLFIGTDEQAARLRAWAATLAAPAELFALTVPAGRSRLNLELHLAVKLCLNTLSTLTMVLMQRVLGNCMIWVSPSNKKLYDRATRCVAQLTGRPYADACDAVFRTMDDLRPRLAAGAEVRAPVLVASIRLLRDCDTGEAETILSESMACGEELDVLLERLRR